jgi:hypothetical protein
MQMIFSLLLCSLFVCFLFVHSEHTFVFISCVFQSSIFLFLRSYDSYDSYVFYSFIPNMICALSSEKFVVIGEKM